jgi:hypothetical protein
MNVREYRPSDLDEVKRIHKKYYAEEFSLTDFLRGYLCVVTIEDDMGIITVGGVRNLAEANVITNKDRSAGVRVKALYNLFDALSFIAKTHGHNQLFAFVQEDKWRAHLIEKGFSPVNGTTLVVRL